MIFLGISFDDSLVSQLKWARTMWKLGLQGVFYISPGRLGKRPDLQRGEWFLTKDHVKEIASCGHLVGNHTWDHEAPRKNTPQEVLESIKKAAEWLEIEGYSPSFLALPWGVRGGGWTAEALEGLKGAGYILRDVAFEGERDRLLPSALESTALGLAPGENLRYFHGNRNTPDDQMARFLYHVASLRDKGELRLLLPQKGKAQWLP